MIVHDFHVGRVAICPHKAEAILVFDANAVLPLPVAFERFQVVAGERGQILAVAAFQAACSVVATVRMRLQTSTPPPGPTSRSPRRTQRSRCLRSKSGIAMRERLPG
jgi:hypothetical protein